MIICLIYNYINGQSWSKVKPYQEFFQILQILTFKFSYISQEIQDSSRYSDKSLGVCI